MEMSRLTRDGAAEPVPRDQILRHERGQENIHFPCSADHGQDWQPYPVDSYSCYVCNYTYIVLLLLFEQPLFLTKLWIPPLRLNTNCCLVNLSHQKA